MNSKILIASIVLLAASTSPALAMTNNRNMALNASTTIAVKLDTSARTKADAEISARITALNNLKARVDQMAKISASEKTSLDNNIQTSIADMTSLKAKIDADTDAATLKADLQSITKSYRVYMLVMPQTRIIAAADRALSIADSMETLSLKLQSRASSSSASELTDMNAKIADAKIQANASISIVASLQPDNGDKTVFASNRAALKDARAKIKLATADLVAARKDAGIIVKALVLTNK